MSVKNTSGFNFEQQNKAFMDVCLAFRALQNINDRLRQNAFALLHFIMPPELIQVTSAPFQPQPVNLDALSSLSSSSSSASSSLSNSNTSATRSLSRTGSSVLTSSTQKSSKIEQQRRLTIQQLCNLGFPLQDVLNAIESLAPQMIFDTDYKSAVIAKIKVIHPTY